MDTKRGRSRNGVVEVVRSKLGRIRIWRCGGSGHEKWEVKEWSCRGSEK